MKDYSVGIPRHKNFYMNIIASFLSCLLFIQCSVGRSPDPISAVELADLEKFERLDKSNRVIIADKNEPGEKLTLCLTFLDKEFKNPLIN